MKHLPRPYQPDLQLGSATPILLASPGCSNRSLEALLKQAGIPVCHVGDSAELQEALATSQSALAILDPGFWRPPGLPIPVLIFPCGPSLQDRLRVLEEGAALALPSDTPASVLLAHGLALLRRVA